MRTCAGCGDVVDITLGVDRRPNHGGITNYYGGTTVYCYRNPGWWLIVEGPDPPPFLPFPFRISEYATQVQRERAEALELYAHMVILGSLRPRLEWAARRPRALRLLKRLGLWTPPTITVPSERADGLFPHVAGIASAASRRPV